MFCVFVTISLYIYSITLLILSFIQSKTNSCAKISSKIVVFKIFKFKTFDLFDRITRFERVTKKKFAICCLQRHSIFHNRVRKIFSRRFSKSISKFSYFRFRLFKRVFFVNNKMNEKYDNDDKIIKKKLFEEISQMRHLKQKIV